MTKTFTDVKRLQERVSWVWQKKERRKGLVVAIWMEANLFNVRYQNGKVEVRCQPKDFMILLPDASDATSKSAK